MADQAESVAALPTERIEAEVETVAIRVGNLEITGSLPCRIVIDGQEITHVVSLRLERNWNTPTPWIVTMERIVTDETTKKQPDKSRRRLKRPPLVDKSGGPDVVP